MRSNALGEKTILTNLVSVIELCVLLYAHRNDSKKNANAVYACINQGQARIPKEIVDRWISFDIDIADALSSIIKICSI